MPGDVYLQIHVNQDTQPPKIICTPAHRLRQTGWISFPLIWVVPRMRSFKKVLESASKWRSIPHTNIYVRSAMARLTVSHGALSTWFLACFFWFTATVAVQCVVTGKVISAKRGNEQKRDQQFGWQRFAEFSQSPITIRRIKCPVLAITNRSMKFPLKPATCIAPSFL